MSSEKLKSRRSNPSKVTKADSQNWVIVAPKAAFSKESATIVPLRHPRTRKSVMYLFSEENSDVFELMAYKPEYGSWFINDTVKEDGKLHMITPMDPLFLALPYLIAAKKENRTLPLDDLFIDEEFPESCRINSCQGLSYLKLIADRKGGEEINAWAYNEEKTLSWLKEKTENLMEALSNQNMSGINGGAVSKTFVMCSKLLDTEDTIGCLNNACGFISEYLPDELTKKLRAHLNLPDVETLKRKNSSEQISAKRSKLDVAGQGVPSGPTNNPLPKKTPAKGPTAKEKSQMRAAAGSKTITSFFKKK